MEKPPDEFCRKPKPLNIDGDDDDSAVADDTSSSISTATNGPAQSHFYYIAGTGYDIVNLQTFNRTIETHTKATKDQ